MSRTAEDRKASFIKGVGIGSLVLGLLFVLGGIGTWIMVSSQLSEENITVAGDAPFLAGSDVNGPFSAYAQAEVIQQHALAGSEGTYAELGAMVNEARDAGDEDRAEELQAQRDTMMNASFLRASLFTSVLAFGVSAMVIGLGVLLVLIGLVIRQLSVGFRAAPAQPVSRVDAVETDERA
ncbi:aromatic ring-opening dioxygenase LigA [Bogoriella caseilytica]|uniref:Aromatic ring-opening dioxygenase LigA n=1 Tax=Bogoriella caseilytica TaxID=56055 RepID=A0A3N2BF24_9MICO|nr:aromatic ring-opening dioxygenase LigA [Bogoriella caseilytica]ROR73866.1 hypothetical protein EDD31_2258 [Bogoriella caseilytica]